MDALVEIEIAPEVRGSGELLGKEVVTDAGHMVLAIGQGAWQCLGNLTLIPPEAWVNDLIVYVCNLSFRGDGTMYIYVRSKCPITHCDPPIWDVHVRQDARRTHVGLRTQRKFLCCNTSWYDRKKRRLIAFKEAIKSPALGEIAQFWITTR